MKNYPYLKEIFTCVIIFTLTLWRIGGLYAQGQPSGDRKVISFREPTYVPGANNHLVNGTLAASYRKAITEPGEINTSSLGLSLEQCYEIALENNGSLKQEKNKIKAALIDKKIARYSLLPSLSYNMGHYFSFGKNIDPVTNTFSFESFSGGYATLGLDLDLFSGFKKIYSIKETTLLLKVAVYNKKKSDLDLLTNIAIAYSKLLLDKEELSHKRGIIDNTFKELNIINEKIKVGRLTKYEFYSFDGRLNTEQADLVTLQNDSLNTVQDLRQLLNISYKEKIDIALVNEATLQNMYKAEFSEDRLIEGFMQTHPAIKQAEAIVQATRMQLKVTKSSFLPSLFIAGNLVSNYNTDQKDFSGGKISLPSQLNGNLGKNINIGLSIPIFSQMEKINQVKKERINISTAQLEVENVKDAVTTNILHLLNDFNGARQKYQATLSALKENTLSYDLYLEKYRLGQISSLELITAQDILNAATSKYLESKIELYFQYQLLDLLKTYAVANTD